MGDGVEFLAAGFTAGPTGVVAGVEVALAGAMDAAGVVTAGVVGVGAD
jgi:hypothetical protein